MVPVICPLSLSVVFNLWTVDSSVVKAQKNNSSLFQGNGMPRALGPTLLRNKGEIDVSMGREWWLSIVEMVSDQILHLVTPTPSHLARPKELL